MSDLGREAVAIIDDLRRAGRLTETYGSHLAWVGGKPFMKAAVPPVEEGESIEDFFWRTARGGTPSALDIEHPATKGCMLAMLREVSGDRGVFVARLDADSEPYWTACDGETPFEGLHFPGWTQMGATEGAALVEALRTFRDGGLGEP